jgi:hypothetical protein
MGDTLGGLAHMTHSGQLQVFVLEGFAEDELHLSFLIDSFSKDRLK